MSFGILYAVQSQKLVWGSNSQTLIDKQNEGRYNLLRSFYSLRKLSAHLRRKNNV